jgi:hypothetical protein
MFGLGRRYNTVPPETTGSFVEWQEWQIRGMVEWLAGDIVLNGLTVNDRMAELGNGNI